MSNKGVAVLLLLATLSMLGCSGDPGQLSPDPAKRSFASTSWAPQSCPTEPNKPRVAQISINKWQAKEYDTRGRYADNTIRPWVMVFSQNVRYVGPVFEKFLVADELDRLQITHTGGTTTYSWGTEPPQGTPVGPFQVKPGPDYATTKYLEWKWTTGSDHTQEGYDINRIMIMCTGQNPPAQNNTWVMRNHPYDGYLLDTNDVIYLWTKQPAGYEMGFLLWPYLDQGVQNFDLCVSTNHQLPSPSTGECSLLPAFRPDMVVLPAWGQPGQGERNVYIAIGSQEGSGQFRFYANVHTNELYPSMPAAAFVPFPPTEAHKEQIRTQMRKISQAAYFATDGRHLIREWFVNWDYAIPGGPGIWLGPQFFWSPDNLPDECVECGCSTPCCDPDGWIRFSAGTLADSGWCGCDPRLVTCQACPNYLQWRNEEWAAEFAVHEMGHCIYGVDDEYLGCSGSGDHCGHSIMGESNFSYEAQNNDFCDSSNGGKDPWGGCTSGHPVGDNNWDCIKSRLENYVGFPSQWTPDAFYQTAPQLWADAPFVAPIVTIYE